MIAPNGRSGGHTPFLPPPIQPVHAMLVSSATGLARETIRNGRRELAEGAPATGLPLRSSSDGLSVAFRVNATAATLLQQGQPVISVDTKKKELVGDFKNAGREWQPTQTPAHVQVHDFPSQAVGKAIPYGVHDMARNEAWVCVGRDHDTSRPREA